MKKILLVFDGSNFSEAGFEFVKRLNLMQPVLVTGVFVPQVDYANLWSYSAAAGSGVPGPAYIPMVEEEDAELIRKNIVHFEKLCKSNRINYRVHKEYFDFALPELKKESRFADVVLLSGELFYQGVRQGSQFEYLRVALHASECPVLIIPEHFRFPNNNILAYDGSEESVYAIKQFAYIFPEFAKNETLLVYADEEEETDFPSKENISELADQHYKNLTLYRLQVDAKKYFSNWISERRGSILVTGSFSRSAISELFKRSFVKHILESHTLPVFIAHK